MNLPPDDARRLMIENLQTLMRAKNISQKKLSVDAGLHETALRDILKGHTVEPGVVRMKRICTALGCGVDDLFSNSFRVEPRQKTVLESLNPENYRRLIEIAQAMRDSQDLARLRAALSSDYISGVPSD